MNDPPGGVTDERPAPAASAATDSHGPARKPRGQAALSEAKRVPQNGLAVPPAVPLHLKPVLNGYSEVAAVGICSERALRRHIATGRVKRAVIRNGRNLRFVVQDLIDELRQAEG